MTEYRIPAEQTEVRQEIKKSVFITYLLPVSDRAEAYGQLESIRQQHPDARHHCWAMVCGAPTDPHSLGFSDDGEPSGTAGKPMLAQLQGSGLGQILAVVVRYSGGIKLGTGGLVRAYGGGVAEALNLLPTQRYVPKCRVQLQFAYSEQPVAERVCRQFDGEIIESDYGEEILMVLELPSQLRTSFIEVLADRSKGKITLKSPSPQ